MKDPMDRHWEEATLEERKEVYKAYMLCDSYPKASWEQADACWTGSRFITIKYTFCPVGYWG